MGGLNPTTYLILMRGNMKINTNQIELYVSLITNELTERNAKYRYRATLSEYQKVWFDCAQKVCKYLENK